MTTNNEWTKLRDGEPVNEEFPVMVGQWDKNRGWREHACFSYAHLGLFADCPEYTHWRSIRADPPPQMQHEEDEAAFGAWCGHVEGQNGNTRFAWHAGAWHAGIAYARGKAKGGDAMNTQETQWNLLSERLPPNDEFPVVLGWWGEYGWKEYPYFVCSQVDCFKDYTHWRSIKVNPPPRVKTQRELDDAAFMDWYNCEGAGDAVREAWHAALARERAEVKKVAP